jgi:6-pyruvoyltetrahydropterin/6-carboxytetrahydropterin synthase
MAGIFEIFVRSEFAAAHCLRGYPGDCARLHGHNWTVEVSLRCSELDRIGLGIDFREVKEAIKEVMAELDHADLNDHPYFKEMNPSSENIAVYLYRELGKRLDSDRVKVSGIKVSESPGQGVIYRE